MAAGAAVVAFALAAKRAITSIFSTVSRFQDEMAQVGIVTQATDADLDKLRQTARDLGKDTIFAADEAATGLKFLGQAGLNAEQAIAAIPATLNLATAAQLGLAAATDITIGILAGYGKDISEATRVTDLLVVAQANAKQSVEEFGAGFGKAGPAAKAARIEIEETAAALGVLADAAFEGEEGGTALRNIIIALVAPTSRAKAALKDLDLTVKDVDVQARGLAPVLETLRDSNIDLTTAVDIFGKRMASQALVLTENAEKVQENSAAFKQLGGEAAAAAKVMEETLGGAFKLLKSQITDLTLSREGGIAGFGQALIQVASVAVTFFDSTLLILQGTIIGFGGILVQISSGAVKLFADSMGLATDAVNLLGTALPFVKDQTDATAQRMQSLSDRSDELAVVLRQTSRELKDQAAGLLLAATTAEQVDVVLNELVGTVERQKEAQEDANKATEDAAQALDKQASAVQTLTGFVDGLLSKTQALAQTGGVQPVGPEASQAVKDLIADIQTLEAEEEKLRDKFLLTGEELVRQGELGSEIADKRIELSKAERKAVDEVADAGLNVVATEKQIQAARAKNKDLQEKLLALQEQFGESVAISRQIDRLKTMDAQLGAVALSQNVTIENLIAFEDQTARSGKRVVEELKKVEEASKAALDKKRIDDAASGTEEIASGLSKAAEAGDRLALSVKEVDGVIVITQGSIEKTAEAVDDLAEGGATVFSEFEAALERTQEEAAGLAREAQEVQSGLEGAATAGSSLEEAVVGVRQPLVDADTRIESVNQKLMTSIDLANRLATALQNVAQQI